MSADIESSFLLFETMNEGVPTDHASGCLVEYKNKKYFLSVAHAVKKATFYLQEKYLPNLSKTKLVNIGQFNRIGKFVVDEQMKQNPTRVEQILSDMINDNLKKENIIDFAYKEITDETFKLGCFFQLFTQENYGTITNEIKKKYFKINRKIIPKIHETCFFAGLILPTQYTLLNGTLVQEYSLQKAEIEFLGDYENNEGYYKFRSLKPMKEDIFYRGCSGSPILNSRGRLIALVNGGNAKLNEIYGISIETCKKYLDLDILKNNVLVNYQL